MRALHESPEVFKLLRMPSASPMQLGRIRTCRTGLAPYDMLTNSTYGTKSKPGSVLRFDRYTYRRSAERLNAMTREGNICGQSDHTRYVSEQALCIYHLSISNPVSCRLYKLRAEASPVVRVFTLSPHDLFNRIELRD